MKIEANQGAGSSAQTQHELRREFDMVLPSASRVSFVLVTAVVSSFAQLDAQEAPTVKLPRIVGQYVTVYRPRGDRFPGPNTRELTAGKWYDDWVPNDHTILKGPDNRWHAFGITHPLTSTHAIHEGEFQSFHAMAPKGPLDTVLRDGVGQEQPKVLPPSQRELLSEVVFLNE